MSSFSKSISLTSINAGSPREAFEGVRNDGPEKSEPCPSSMVEKDKPHPAPHPSPGMWIARPLMLHGSASNAAPPLSVSAPIRKQADMYVC